MQQNLNNDAKVKIKLNLNKEQKHSKKHVFLDDEDEDIEEVGSDEYEESFEKYIVKSKSQNNSYHHRAGNR